MNLAHFSDALRASTRRGVLLTAIATAGMMVLSAVASPAWAQYGGGGYGDEGYILRSSTPAEAAARGLADVVRSQGQFNRLSAEAAVQATEAFGAALENSKKAIDTYYARQHAARSYRQAQRRSRPTQEDLIRYSQAGRPPRLSPSQLDGVTGRISWPILLDDPAYRQHRAELEELFDRRAVARSLGDGDRFDARQYLRVRRLTAAMRIGLKSQIRQYPPQDYIAAKRFLDGLAHEARLFGTGEASLAANVNSVAADQPPVPEWLR